MILGHPGLGKLARLKLRGTLRRQARRLRSPSGILFALMGLGVMVLWLSAILLNTTGRTKLNPPQPVTLVAVEACLAAFTLMALSSAPNVKGITLPRCELESLFSAPVSRGDLVRHRMQVDLGRAVLGGVIFSIIAMSRLPHPLFSFVGTFMTLITLSVVRQMASLALCGVGGLLGRLASGRANAVVGLVVGIGLFLGLMMLIFGDTFFLSKLSVGVSGGLAGVLESPFVALLVAPWRPWAEMMIATSVSGFLGWALPCALLLPVLYEATARVPADFREASLHTAGQIERRQERLKTAGPLGGGKVPGALSARPIPWFFGRGPARAVIWVRTADIWRRARGTLLRSAMILGLITVGAGYIVSEGAGGVLGGHLIVAWIGLIYLGAGVRFDFRADLDRMEQIKTWPIGASRLFLVSLLPGVFLISALVGAAISIRAAVLGAGHPALPIILVTLPIWALAWIAVDNIVFLYAPVRFIPGQDGALHHTGRTMVLLLLRMGLLLFALGLVALASAVVMFVCGTGLGLGESVARAGAVCAGALALLSIDAGLVWVGGRMLRRFDVARDRA